MSRSVRKGYCRDCQANVNHVRRFDSNIAWLLDTMTFYFVSRFRLGAWHCLQCTRKSVYLKLPRPGGRTIVIGGDSSPKDFADVEGAGNYIRRDRSLVARRERSSRYSAKYRESIVQKILDGHATIAEVKRELSLSESDLIDWIASVVAEQAEKIAQMTKMLEAFSADENVHLLTTDRNMADDVLEAKAVEDTAD